MSAAVQTQTGQQDVQVVTTEDLLKSLAEVEGKAPEKKDPPAPEAVTVTLTKGLKDEINGNGSAELKKALEVSKVLGETVGHMGTHVDNVLQTMAKNYNDQQKVNLSIVTCLVEMKKSLDANTAALAEIGKQPGAPAAGAAPKTEVLHKSVVAEGLEGPEAKAAARKQVLTGLELLTKSLQPEDPRSKQYAAALVKFESTGKISDSMLTEALKAGKQ